MKCKDDLFRAKQDSCGHWKQLAIATGIAFFCMLPTAQSESEYAEQVKGSPFWQAHHVSYPFGYRRLSSQWGDARNQLVFGFVDLDAQPRSWPVSFVTRLAFGYSGALPIGADPRASFSGSWDIDVGLRRVWSRPGTLQPFVGGGLALVGASTTIQIRTKYSAVYVQNWHPTTVGPFVEAGCYFPIRGNWHTGILISYTKGEGNLNNHGLEMGGIQAAVLIGKTWDAKRGPSSTGH
jgi:hypothetical protein